MLEINTSRLHVMIYLLKTQIAYGFQSSQHDNFFGKIEEKHKYVTPFDKFASHIA